MAIISDISKQLSVAPSTLTKYISSAPYRYKVYKIEKRNGSGFREIAQPARELKFLQKYVMNSYLKNLPVHGVCTAYIKNKNIRNNAVRHAGKKYFLKMDFQNFFPSITPSDLIKHIESKLDWKIFSEDKEVVSRLFFYAKDRYGPLKLSIGAPTSPFISNSIMYDFDCVIYDICKDRDVVYTRYADDLVFSTNQKDILFGFIKTIEDTLNGLQYPTMKLNQKKTSFLSKKGNVHITGLVLTNDGKVSIGRDKKRYIKSMIYQFSKNELPERDRSYLEGYLSFCWSVDREFIVSLEKKYGSPLMNSLRGIRDTNEQ